MTIRLFTADELRVPGTEHLWVRERTWRYLLTQAVMRAGDGPILACTYTEQELDTPVCDRPPFYIHAGFCNTDFAAWSVDRVYAAAENDITTWIVSVPRNLPEGTTQP